MPPSVPCPPPTPAFVWVQATYRQKAIPFIIEGNPKAVVSGLGELAGRGRGAGRGAAGKGHITFQMTKQRFIYQLAFLHEEEK